MFLCKFVCCEFQRKFNRTKLRKRYTLERYKSKTDVCLFVYLIVSFTLENEGVYLCYYCKQVV